MHPYIPHPLTDIAAAHRTAFPGEKFLQTMKEHFEATDRWVGGEEPEHRFAYYCGLDPGNFPPAEQLCGEEIILIKAKHIIRIYI